MILLFTSSWTGTADDLAYIFGQRNIPFFRFNTDLYDQYQFLWQGEEFEIIDPLGRVCNSHDVSICVMYKCILWPPHMRQRFDKVKDPLYVTYILNELCGCVANWAMNRKLLRLWHPTEYACPKTRQMEIAKKYFSVPDFSIHWGFSLPEKRVIAKQLIQRSLDDGSLPYADAVDRAVLDTAYPWLTQDIADGNRDATVLYVNGNVHCFQFASERGELNDWRITQGTERNKWMPWNAGSNFDGKICAFMQELGLKFGRFDFIIGGREPQFLEVNARGQFGWLDDEKLTLNNEVVDAILDPSSTVTC